MVMREFSHKNQFYNEFLFNSENLMFADVYIQLAFNQGEHSHKDYQNNK